MLPMAELELRPSTHHTQGLLPPQPHCLEWRLTSSDVILWESMTSFPFSTSLCLPRSSPTAPMYMKLHKAWLACTPLLWKQLPQLEQEPSIHCYTPGRCMVCVCVDACPTFFLYDRNQPPPTSKPSKDPFQGLRWVMGDSRVLGFEALDRLPPDWA